MEKIVEESNIIYMIVIKHKQSSICNILKEYPKSAWNTLDFENGAGPLAMINPKLDKLLV